MSPHHSNQMYQRSQVSGIALWRCSVNVFVFVIVFVLVFVFVFVIVFLVGLVMSPHHSDQMSQRSQVSGAALCMSKVKVAWVSQSVSEWQGHLLSCSGQLKINKMPLYWVSFLVDWSRTRAELFKVGKTFLVSLYFVPMHQCTTSLPLQQCHYTLCTLYRAFLLHSTSVFDLEVGGRPVARC